MIGRLRGITIEKQPPLALIEVDGAGYGVHIPVTCFYRLPEADREVVVLTHSVVCEDARLLYGFGNKQRHTSSGELIKTSGVGLKLALAIPSGMSTQQFVSAIEREGVEVLVKLLGAGKEAAERLVVEMKDRLKGLYDGFFTPAADLVPTSPASPTTDDAEQKAAATLVALGYKPQEASRTASKIARPDASSETLVREALRVAL